MSNLLKSVAERAINYQRNLDSRSVSPSLEAVRRLAAQLDLAETARAGQPRRSADFS